MMVRQMKEDAKGKSEEELAECFRIFDRCPGQRRAAGRWFRGDGVRRASGERSQHDSGAPLPFLKERRRLHRCRGAG